MRHDGNSQVHNVLFKTTLMLFSSQDPHCLLKGKQLAEHPAQQAATLATQPTKGGNKRFSKHLLLCPQSQLAHQDSARNSRAYIARCIKP